MRLALSVDPASRCARFAILLAAAAALLGPRQAKADAFPDTVFGNRFEVCTGLECAQLHCGGAATTSISGTVFAPNGTLPLPNVEVYVPNAAVGALTDGPGSGRCDQAPLGHPLVATLTGTNGNFTLKNMPAASSVPVVIIAGKWRRQITVPAVAACVDTALPADQTRLPHDHIEGDIPHTAIVTGSADSLECLFRKTGVADTEFGTSPGSARIHLFTGNGTANLDNGGGSFADATTLWASSASLSAYDQVMLACEGSQNYSGSQPQSAMDAMQAYTDAGGRVYLAHWQNFWIIGDGIGRVGIWPTIGTWSFNGFNDDLSLTAIINGAFFQGSIMKAWLFATGASASLGSVVVTKPRETLLSVDETLARKWISQTTSVHVPSVLYASFTTPVDVVPAAQQGRVLFVDLHASAADLSSSGLTFPSGGCLSAVTPLSPQEQALLYASFDLQRCVGSTRE